MREAALERIIQQVLSRKGRKEQGEHFNELLAREDLKTILLKIRRDITTKDKEANERINKYLRVVWDEYLATSFDHADIIDGKQYA